MRIFEKMITAAVSLCICLPVTAFASEVNSHEVKNGDIVTYEIHAISCPTLIQAVDCTVYYDSNSLEYIDGTLSMPAFDSPVYNTDISGEIRINVISLDGYDLSEDSVIASAQFRVKDGSSENISLYYNMKNFFDENDTDLHSEYTYDMTSVSPASDAAEQIISIPAAEKKSDADTEQEDVDSDQPIEESDITVSDNDAGTPAASENVERETQRISSDVQSDIPSDMAITFETLDTAVPDLESRRKHFIVMAMSAAMIALIAVVIVTLTKGSGGSHSK